MNRLRLGRAGLVLAALLAIAAPVRAQAGARACDRACLTRLASDYLAALAVHAPRALPLAADVRFSENGVALPIGEALWSTASAVERTGIVAADPASHSVALLATVMEGQRPALLAARLTTRAGRIAEIETIVVRREAASFLSAAGFAKAPALPSPAAPAERVALRAPAERYFTALLAGDGSVPPLAPDCDRVENGVQTTNTADPLPGVSPSPFDPAMTSLGCAEQFRRGLLRFVTALRGLRYPVIDAQAGIVVAFGMFDHDGRPHPGPPGKAVSRTLGSPFSFSVAEFFVVRDGRIARIEAALSQTPFGLIAPWR